MSDDINSINISDVADDCYVYGCTRKVKMRELILMSSISNVPLRQPAICQHCKRPACQECSNKQARGEKLICKLCDEHG